MLDQTFKFNLYYNVFIESDVASECEFLGVVKLQCFEGDNETLYPTDRVRRIVHTLIPRSKDYNLSVIISTPEMYEKKSIESLINHGIVTP